MTKFRVCVSRCFFVCVTVVLVANICRIIEWNMDEIREEIFVDLLILLVY